MYGGIFDWLGSSVELRRAAESSFENFLEQVRQGQKSGLFQPAPTREIVLSLWSSMHGLALLAIGRQLDSLELPGDLEQVARNTAQSVLRGLWVQQDAP